MGNIFDIQRFCLDDGPGIRTVVFFKGCPMNCLWCHNPESKAPAVQRYSDTGETIGYTAQIGEIIDTVLKDRDYYQHSGGGVTLSGGEPLMQADLVLKLLIQLKKLSLHTCVETCGCVRQSTVASVLPYTDLFLYDIKAMPSVHQKYTGKSSQLILSNLNYLYESGASIQMRCPIIPGINDTLEHFTFLASLLKKYPDIQEAEIMPYHNMGIAKARRLGEKEPFYCDNPSVEQTELWRKTLSDMTGAVSHVT